MHASGFLNDVFENSILRLKLIAKPARFEAGKPFSVTFQVNPDELSWNGCNNWILAIRGTGKGNEKDRFYAIQTVRVLAGLTNCLGISSITLPGDLNPDSAVRLEIYEDNATHEQILSGKKPGFYYGSNPVAPKFVVPRDVILSQELLSEPDKSFYEVAKKEAGQALDKAADTTKKATANLAIAAGVVGGIAVLGLGAYVYFTQVKN